MKRIGLLIFIAMTCVLWANTLPEVSNFSFAQRTDGSMLIDAYYDVLDADGDLLTVNMQASEDGGETWAVSCDSIFGDIGENIISGTGKQIIWKFGAEHPGVFSEEYRVRILVDDSYIESIEGMVFVQGGTFEMGDHFNEGSGSELPIHEVTLKSFYIGQYEVTQAEYTAVIGSNPAHSNGVGDNYPVYYVSWHDAAEYCNALSIQKGLTPCYDLSDWSCDFSAYGYRLPTEAEWEYASRGGVNWTDNYRYSGTTDNLGDYVVYNANALGHTEVVGNKLSNQLDIYDMSGNVWEWCNDWWLTGYYSSSPANNPTGPDNGYTHVKRGGSWNQNASYCRVAERESGDWEDCGSNVKGIRVLRAIISVNTVPGIPDNPSPGNGAFYISVNTSLDWECSDFEGDELTYDVYLGDIPELDDNHILAEDITESGWLLENLNNNTTYYWKIKASDGQFETESEVWNFTTIEEEQSDGLLFVEGGTFEIGDHFNEGNDDEHPVHGVTLNSFYIGKYEVKQGEYATLMGSNPAYDYGVGDNYPIYNISWYDAVEYCNILSIQDGLTPCYDLSDWNCDFSADGYRLPTEAEWEYASRGGVNWIDNYKYSGTTDNLGDYAVYSANAPEHSEVAGLKLPNQLEIYDMSGNLSEWCNDWYSGSFYSTDPADNPTGPDNGSIRVIRGGYWGDVASDCRVAFRSSATPDYSGYNGGFRILKKSTAPIISDNTYPANWALVPVNIDLSWECIDPLGGELSYDVYFSEIPELDDSHLVAEDITEAGWVLENLNYNTTYYWKITAHNEEFETEGGIWSFTTIEEEQSVSMIFVKGGSFEMGDHFNEGDLDELPVHEVTLNSFWIGQYEVTQAEWHAVMSYSPAHDCGVGDNYPVYYFNWFDAMEYCNTLSELHGLTPCYDGWICDFNANGYRLPTEAEWEYASRGGINWIDDFRYSGSTNNLGDYVWYDPNSGDQTHEVGTKLPNQLEIYDMSGNVWEMCNDWYSERYYHSSPLNNPTGPAEHVIGEASHVRRGGAWNGIADYCRVARRAHYDLGTSSSTLGFRILRSVISENSEPNNPDNPSPENGSLEGELSPILTWECIDPEGDELSYDVYFGEIPELDDSHLVAEDITEAEWALENMSNNITYYWKITASDGEFETEGEVWNFTEIEEEQSDEWCLVSAGEFTWGENDEIQSIYYDYEIMKFEVTNIQYVAYLEEAYAAGDITVTFSSVTGYYEGDENYSAGDYEYYDLDQNGRISWEDNNFIIENGYGNHPVVYVSWFGANAYAEHYGWRLPTEREWEKAARGMTGYDYPWGDEFYGCANYHNSNDPWDDGTTPVGYYNGGNNCTIDGSSPYGCYDMCGNVFEMTVSWCSETSSAYVSRGGAWISPIYSDWLKSWNRVCYDPNNANYSKGFRCARSEEIGNAVPDMPENPYPDNGAIDVPVNTSLSWECSDPDWDELSYDVYFGEILELDVSYLVADDITEAGWILENLNINTTYYWKVIASDGEYETEGEVWDFTTIEEIPIGIMVFVEGGTFEMGDHFNEGLDAELPVHDVTLNSFYIGQYEVTQGEYEAVMGSNPAQYYGVDDNYPVYYVTWFNAVEYCNALSEQESLTPCYNLSDWSCDFSADGYRLPTEAEWEYAARGGVNWTDDYRYSGTTDNLGDYAWYDSNSGNQTNEVGTRLPNQLDIYDMSGNVWEWCNDWYSSSYYDSSPVNNPTGPDSGSTRLERGGSWGDNVFHGRIANRGNGNPILSFLNIGFRIFRVIISENTAPYMPENGAIDVPVNTSLSWECSDPNWDELSYDVYFGDIPEIDISHLIAEDITESGWVLENLNNDTTYYWKITARDGEFETEGEVWNFTTVEEVQIEGMVFVEGGTFEMGDHFNEGYGNELPIHDVTLSSFYIGQYEVTQAEYATIIGSNPAHNCGVGDNYPVYYVNWYDAVEYCNALSIQEGLTPCYDLSDWSCDFSADGYRLPTEAEWEYAARGGVNWTDNYRYSGTTDNLEDYVIYSSNDPGGTATVGSKLPNQLAIYDMSGNEFEFCNDWYSDSYYSSSPVNNPTGPDSGSARVLRGGGWVNDAFYCRVAKRSSFTPNYGGHSIGFRILRAYSY